MFAALGMDVGSDTFDLSFHEPPLGERSGQPMMLGMGDSVAGPLLGLFYDAPSDARTTRGSTRSRARAQPLVRQFPHLHEG